MPLLVLSGDRQRAEQRAVFHQIDARQDCRRPRGAPHVLRARNRTVGTVVFDGFADFNIAKASWCKETAKLSILVMGTTSPS